MTTNKTNKCQFAAAGTFGHECGAVASFVRVTVMHEETKTALRCMGAKVPADGLARANRCTDHKNSSEFGEGKLISLDNLA